MIDEHRFKFRYERTAPMWVGLRRISPGEWFLTATCTCGVAFTEPDFKTDNLLGGVRSHFQYVESLRLAQMA